MKAATFNIAGMHCASCAARNERTLKKLAGVHRRDRQLRDPQRPCAV